MMAYSILRGKRLWILLSCLALMFWGWYWVYHNKTLGFSVKKITSNFSYNPGWDVAEPSGVDLKKLLGQKFTYLAAGSQSYAFASEDGKYVIKFFRMKHLIPALRDYLKPGRVEHRRQNLLSIFQAHKLAFEEMRQDSGLVYLHLNKTDHLKTKLEVKDRLGRLHLVDLDQTEFVVQRRAELIFTRLKKMMDAGDRAGMEKAIRSVLEMARRQITLGIADHDKAVSHNYGFVDDGSPIHLDIGRIYKAYRPKDYHQLVQRINRWLQENSSDLSF